MLAGRRCIRHLKAHGGNWNRIGGKTWAHDWVMHWRRVG
jgi:hypothetical protein